MPIIVPIEENREGIAGLTDARFRAPDYSGSGLGALGAGLAQVGDGGQQLASGIEERRRKAAAAIAAAMLDDRHQSNVDDAAVKKAYVDYSDLRHEALHGEDGLFNQTGAAAHAAFPDTIAALADAHDKVIAPLDDVQRGVVGGMLKEELRRDVDRAADHVGRQGVEDQKWQSEQLQRAAARDAANQADDPKLFDHHFETGKNALVQQAKLTGAPDRVLAKQIADYTSGAHTAAIETLHQRDPVLAAGWYARHGDKLNQRDQQRMAAMLSSAVAGDDVSDTNSIFPVHESIAGVVRDLDDIVRQDAGPGEHPERYDLVATNDAQVLDGQAYSKNDSAVTEAGNDGRATNGIAADARALSMRTPVIAKGDGGAPMDLHVGMTVSPALFEWLKDVAPQNQYVIDAPPDFITRFRRAVPGFTSLEEQTFAASKAATPPRERALLVYQSMSDPRKYTIRTYFATDKQGIKFFPGEKRRSSFGRLPEINGFKLIIL